VLLPRLLVGNMYQRLLILAIEQHPCVSNDDLKAFSSYKQITCFDVVICTSPPLVICMYDIYARIVTLASLGCPSMNLKL